MSSKTYIWQDKTKAARGNLSWQLNMKSFGGNKVFYKTEKEARVELKKFLDKEKKELEDSDTWTIHDLLGEFPDKSMMVEWDKRILLVQPLRTFYFAEYVRMKRGKPLPDYFDSYKSIFKSILDINIGNITVGNLLPMNLTVEHCETFILPTLENSGKNGKRSYKTVCEMRSRFNKLMSFAKKRKLISQNPMLEATYDKPLIQEALPLEKISTQYIEDIERAAPKSLLIAYRFAYSTGVRAGEQRALTWNDIWMESFEANINKSAKKKMVDVDTGEIISYGVGYAKTRTSNRIIPIPAPILRELKELFIKLGRPNGKSLVFCTKYGGTIAPSRWKEQLQAVAKKINGKHIRWHDLRHYYASRMLEYYIGDIWTVSNLMGHSNTDITERVYGHWMRDLKKQTKLREDSQKIWGS